MRKLILVGVLVASAAGGWRLMRPDPAAAPVLSTAFARLDADVQGPIQAAIDRVLQEPLDAKLRADLAMIYHAHGLVDAVEATYLQALELDPTQAKWWYSLALHRRSQADLAGAVEACRETIRLAPDYIPAERSLGGLLLDLDRLEEARAVFELACRQEPEHTANQTGLARVHLQLENWEEAVRLLETVTRLQPRYGYAFMLLGRAYLGTGERDKARIASTRGAGALPPDFDPWAAELLTRRTGYTGAMKEAERLFQGGRDDDAIRILTGMREQHPDDPLLLSNLASAYGRKQEIDTMFSLLLHSVERNPDPHPTRLNLSYAYLQKGDPESALVHVERAIELNPVLGASYAHRCEVFAALGQLDQAIASIETAIELKGASLKYRLRLGQLLHETGAYEDALLAFEELTKLFPNSIKGLHCLARSLVAVDRIEDAERALERARAVNAGHWGHAVVEQLIRERSGR